jgi:hypothetical protein
MRSSSRLWVVGLEWLAGVQHRPEHVDAPSGQGDQGLVVAFALASFMGVKARLSGEDSEQNADW